MQGVMEGVRRELIGVNGENSFLSRE